MQMFEQIKMDGWMDKLLPKTLSTGHVNLTLGHLPDQSWKCRPGLPNNRWIDQLCRDNNNTPPADLWRRSTTRDNTGVTLRSSTTTHWRWRRKTL